MLEDQDVQPPATGRPMRKLIKELETPDEVAEEVRRFCAKLGLVTARDRKRVEDEMKLQYYFGGKDVAYLPTTEGRLVVAIGRMCAAEFEKALDCLSSDERRNVIFCSPRPWKDQTSCVLTAVLDED